MEFGRIVITDNILKIKNKEKVLSDKIKKFKKLYNEFIKLQHIINHYGCNMVFLSECSNISNLKEDGMLSDGDFENYTNLFTACITDDLNTANAITVIYSLLKDETVNGTTKIELIRSFDRVLALDLLKKDEAKREDHDLIMKLIEKRNSGCSFKEPSSRGKHIFCCLFFVSKK